MEFDVADLWKTMKTRYINSAIAKQELIDALKLGKESLKDSDWEYPAGLISRRLTEVFNRQEHGAANEVNRLNFIVELLVMDADGKRHVKLAFQFLRAMTETSGWDKYVKQVLTINRKDIAGAGGDRDRRKNSILHEAARLGYCGIFKKYFKDLPEEGVNMLNAQRETPLHLAAEFGHLKDVTLLLNMKAKILSDALGATPLHSAAMSLKQNADVARLLVEKMSHTQMHERIEETGDTALHCAVKNRMFKPEFIDALGPMDPLQLNKNNETVFHLSANSINHEIFVSVIKVFSSANCGWDISDVDKGNCQYLAIKKPARIQVNMDEPVPLFTRTMDTCSAVIGRLIWGKSKIVKENITLANRINEPAEPAEEAPPPQPPSPPPPPPEERTYLIDICARRGNAKAVAALIENGADIDKGVLHTIIDESVKHPDKISSLKDVYHAITENAMLWYYIAHNVKRPPKGSFVHHGQFQQIMIDLMAKKVKERPENQNGTNPIEFAVQIGAAEMLLEILNTERAFKFEGDDKKQRGYEVAHLKYDVYDVTDFVEETRSKDKIRKPKKPYLDSIIDHHDEWQDKDILGKQPFAKLSKPYIKATQRFFLLIGLVQLIYMIWFSVKNVNGDFSPYTNDIQSILLLSWPISVLIFNVLSIIFICWMFISWINDFRRKKIRGTRPTVCTLLTKFLLGALEKVPLTVFCLSAFVWFDTRFDNSEHFQMSKSLVLLFGWMIAFSFLAGAKKEIHVFIILLKRLIVEDILLRFGILFSFTVVAFASSIHVIRCLPPSTGVDVGLNHTTAATPVSFGTTLFRVFVVSMGIGNEVMFADEGLSVSATVMYKLVFAVYVLMTAIVLLNVLIAMIQQRFEQVLRQAETDWRFEVLTTAMTIKHWKKQMSALRKKVVAGLRGYRRPPLVQQDDHIYHRRFFTYVKIKDDKANVK